VGVGASSGKRVCHERRAELLLGASPMAGFCSSDLGEKTREPPSSLCTNKYFSDLGMSTTP
jgi:hypothetical protein